MGLDIKTPLPLSYNIDICNQIKKRLRDNSKTPLP